MKRTIVVLAVFAVLAATYATYLYFKEPEDTRREEPDYTLSAEELAAAYNLNEDSANARFADKVLVVDGEVSDIQVTSTEGTVFLMSSDPLTSITCSFYSDEAASLRGIKRGDHIRVKGKCTGKLADVILNNCSIVNNP